MPRFFFHVQYGDQLIRDLDGVVISNPEAVRDECRKILEEALQEEGWRGDLRKDRALKVVDELGRVVVTVPFERPSDVLEPLSAGEPFSVYPPRAGMRSR
jgi:hypothetical protein